MVRIGEIDYRTVSDATKDFGVSAKTIRDWISKGIISPPPQIEHGARIMDCFPLDYVEKAKAELKMHRDKNKNRGKK